MHLTCSRLKSLFCGCCSGRSGGKSLSPDTQLILSCFLISTRNIMFGLDRHTRRQVSPHCDPANRRPSIAFLKHVSCCNFSCYFGTSLWQTQLKFLHINQTPPHPINTALGMQLLLSLGLIELCAQSLQKFPSSSKPKRDRVMVLTRDAVNASSEKE